MYNEHHVRGFTMRQIKMGNAAFRIPHFRSSKARIGPGVYSTILLNSNLLAVDDIDALSGVAYTAALQVEDCAVASVQLNTCNGICVVKNTDTDNCISHNLAGRQLQISRLCRQLESFCRNRNEAVRVSIVNVIYGCSILSGRVPCRSDPPRQ